MSSINHVVLIGRLARDPEQRTTPTGTTVVNFTIAVDRRPRPDGTKEADFVRIVTFNKTAENCATYLSKGKLAAVEGRLQVRTYQGQDGQNRTATEIIANAVQFLSPKNGNGYAEAPAPDAEVPPGFEWDESNPPF
jgi:single-strand DNA-binding protein